MKNLNRLMTILLTGASIGLVSATIDDQDNQDKSGSWWSCCSGSKVRPQKKVFNDDPGTNSSTVIGVVVTTPKSDDVKPKEEAQALNRITLKDINELRRNNDPGVKILLALPLINGYVRTNVSSKDHRVKENFEIDGKSYDLWSVPSMENLMEVGGLYYTKGQFMAPNDSSYGRDDSWYWLFFDIQRGSLGGESEQPLDVTTQFGKDGQRVWAIKGNVFFHERENTSMRDPYAQRAQHTAIEQNKAAAAKARQAYDAQH